MTIIYLFSALALLLGTYLAVQHVRKTTTIRETPPAADDDHSISQAPAVVEETPEGREERLNNIKNPDIEKPFAKMSVPTLVETSGIESLEEEPQEVTSGEVAEIVSSVAKAARAPRTPKPKPEEQDASATELAPKKKRRKKKPSKPKTDENNPK
jgi:hypothetical protein